MGIKTVVICDCCGAQRQESNHWYTAICFTTPKKIEVLPFQVEVAVEKFDWDILCGEACLHQWLSLNLPRIAAVKPPASPKEVEIPITLAMEPPEIKFDPNDIPF